MKNICISSTFLCLCSRNLSFEPNFDISKKAYSSVVARSDVLVRLLKEKSQYMTKHLKGLGHAILGNFV